MSPQNLPERIAAVRERVARAAAGAGRNAQSVTLLAVGKAQPPELLAAAAGCGLQHFGESYLQEALAKIAALPDRQLTWHFVGRVQANKTRRSRRALRPGCTQSHPGREAPLRASPVLLACTRPTKCQVSCRSGSAAILASASAGSSRRSAAGRSRRRRRAIPGLRLADGKECDRLRIPSGPGGGARHSFSHGGDTLGQILRTH